MSDKKEEEEDDKSEGKPEEVEVLHEEFDCFKRLAESLIRTLKRPKDIEVGNELIAMCETLKSSKYIRVKKKANDFFRLFLRVLNWTSNNQPLDIYKLWYPLKDGGLNTSSWVEPNKSYVASKTLDDGTVIIYSAIASAVDAGWQDNGLKILYGSKKKDADK